MKTARFCKAMTPACDLAKTVRDTIAAKGISARQLAKESGVAQQRISAFLAGGQLQSDNLSKLCTALGLDLRKVKR